MQKSAKKPLFLVGVPTWGQHSFLFTQSLLGGVMPTNFSMQIRFIPQMEIGRARNIIMQEAVNMGAKYLMFRDEDTLAPANIAPALLYHLEHHPDWTFVGGLYGTKSNPSEPLLYTEWGQGPHWGFRKGELIPCLFTGMGASMIRISDIENLPTSVYKERNPWTAQDMEVKEWFKTNAIADRIEEKGVAKQGNTEDAFFFSLLEDAGLKSYVDTNLLCGHLDINTGHVYYVPFDGEYAISPAPWDHSPRVVNVGAGGEDNPYELNVDLQAGPNVDFVCDVRKLPDEWADQVDTVKAHHVLEHFDFSETAAVLTEWLRILKPGGRIEIAVPDLEAVANEIVNGRFDVLIQGNIYGDQAHSYWNQNEYGGYDGERFLPHSNDHNHHKSGFTARALLDVMKSVGFVDTIAERHTDVWEIHAVGYKQPGRPPKEQDEKGAENGEHIDG